VPERIRLSRAKGWRRPANAVVVARPTRWGNPYRVGDELDGQRLSRSEAVALFEEDLVAGRLRFTLAEARAELAGRDLCCWCSLDGPCHAEVLLSIANG
jgi:hypothetical protein